jgi:pilus assembly protein Flp/PilA
MKRKNRKEQGQAIVEYIIIVVIVAIAAFVVIGAFSDRLKDMIAGATTTLGGTPEGHDERSVDQVQEGFQDGEGLDVTGG